MGFKIAYVGNITPKEPFEIEGDGYRVDLADAVACCSRFADVLKAHGIRFELTLFRPDGEEIITFDGKTPPNEQGAVPEP
ncbi:MAG: hypothetical protein AAF657_30070 [Acidobacteriota bacterium]